MLIDVNNVENASQSPFILIIYQLMSTNAS